MSMMGMFKDDSILVKLDRAIDEFHKKNFYRPVAMVMRHEMETGIIVELSIQGRAVGEELTEYDGIPVIVRPDMVTTGILLLERKHFESALPEDTTVDAYIGQEYHLLTELQNNWMKGVIASLVPQEQDNG